jgi:phosphate/sulfate permease
VSDNKSEGREFGSVLILRYKEKDTDPYFQVEHLARPLQVLAASFKSFSHGANDVANAIGPVAVIKKILYAWVLSVPAAGVFSVGLYFLLRLLFG